jgi:hypothetical protein
VAAITADHLHRCPELPTGDVLVIGQPVWIHWRTADVVGARIGKRVADWENSHYFQADLPLTKARSTDNVRVRGIEATRGQTIVTSGGGGRLVSSFASTPDRDLSAHSTRALRWRRDGEPWLAGLA